VLGCGARIAHSTYRGEGEGGELRGLPAIGRVLGNSQLVS
jgi:hypothetical protein